MFAREVFRININIHINIVVLLFRELKLFVY